MKDRSRRRQRGLVRGGVYIVDLDRTIVGDSATLLVKQGVATLAQRLGILTDGAAAIRPWSVDTVSALIRPHFVDFMAAAARDQAHVFIYTHGTAEYADFMVRAIEEVIGRKFERPIFSRDRSSAPGGGKSLAMVAQAIERTLGGKHHHDEPHHASAPLADRIVTIVDDDDTVWAHVDRVRHMFVRCPAYAYVSFVDPFDGFPPAVLRHPDVARYAVENGLYNPAGGPAERYRWCEARLRDVERDNTWLRRDVFWLNFLATPPRPRASPVSRG